MNLQPCPRCNTPTFDLHLTTTGTCNQCEATIITTRLEYINMIRSHYEAPELVFI